MARIRSFRSVLAWYRSWYGHFSFAIAACLILSCNTSREREEVTNGWPGVSRESRPWTRWWWHGNSLTKEGITSEMEAYQSAGIGGLEITPIYGVYGDEQNFVDYLSPEWMELLEHVLKEGERLGVGIDMATGTGWPFGGPWIGASEACKNLRYKIFKVNGGSGVRERIVFIQPPYLRLVGNNIYKPGLSSDGEGRTINTDDVSIDDLVDPVAKTPELQKLAIDQVQFEKPLQLRCLMAYGSNNDVIELTSKVDTRGVLDWIAPSGTWTLYAIFEGYHGKMVERAGPGGEGNVIDHFSQAALAQYLARFDEAFKGHDISSLRAFFNDSYEVDDARGAADFTPALFDEFAKRRGYDLRKELPALLGRSTPEKNARVLCDYRETLSELLLEKFTTQWKEWGHRRNALVRNQAHGSPSNILDLYAAVDIPEIEGTEPLRIKMASSSGNVSGKRLVSAEAATWLNEHFRSDLGDIREALDNFMLHGVNHLVYHGTCYSPPGDAWPGRLFYAAVHLNPRNPQWKDFHALNQYVTRCQSFLQNSIADNDVLLYYPIYDRFSSAGPEMVEHFDGIGMFKGSSFEETAGLLLRRGFGFDYVSDKQLGETSIQNNLFRTSGGSFFKVLVVPRCDYMPLNTLIKLRDMARQGAQIIFVGDLPGSVSGLSNVAEKKKSFESISKELRGLQRQSGSERKPVQVVENVGSALIAAGVRRETMYDIGLQCFRKRTENGEAVYLIKNSGPRAFQGWAQIASDSERLAIFDPVSGKFGKARLRKENSRTEVYLQLERGRMLILTGKVTTDMGDFTYREKDGEELTVDGRWTVSFDSGGPQLPDSFQSDSLTYWTNLPDSVYRNFSGTATYSVSLPPMSNAARWLMELDSAKGTVEVILNGKTIGTVLSPRDLIEIEGRDLLSDGRNVLELKVSNLMANRIAYMDRNQIFWKKFYNVNFPSRFRENSRNNVFDASQWKTSPSGIQGKVRLWPLKD